MLPENPFTFLKDVRKVAKYLNSNGYLSLQYIIPFSLQREATQNLADCTRNQKVGLNENGMI